MGGQVNEAIFWCEVRNYTLICCTHVTLLYFPPNFLSPKISQTVSMVDITIPLLMILLFHFIRFESISTVPCMLRTFLTVKITRKNSKSWILIPVNNHDLLSLPMILIVMKKIDFDEGTTGIVKIAFTSHMIESSWLTWSIVLTNSVFLSIYSMARGTVIWTEYEEMELKKEKIRVSKGVLFIREKIWRKL